LAVGAVADDVTVKGRVKYVVMHPDVVVTVDTDKGFKQLFLGTEDDFEGVKLWLDRSDIISAVGRTEPGTSHIIAERIWVNGGYFALPAKSMGRTGSTNRVTSGISTAMAPSASLAREVSSRWMDEPRSAADAMLTKYGAPDEITDNRMIWHNNGPWKRTELVNQEIPHNFPMPHHDMLLQVVDYKVPTDMFDELAMYDGSVIVDRTKGEIGARCDKEGANFLALNLAHDVVTRAKTPDQARDFYAKAISAKMSNSMTTEQSNYMSRLLFSTPRANTADPDRRHGG
jgi:hypothetical protein